MASAGRILIMPKGEWEAEKEYKMLDLVSHKGYAFLAKKPSINIEPSNDNTEYWFALLDINKIVEEGVSNVVAEDVANILDVRFQDFFGKAVYASNLLEDYTEAMFVRWNAETENTPYKAKLTECTEGFALVYGTVANNHTVVSWTMGGEVVENFVHYIRNGEDKSWKSSLQDFNDFAKQTNEELKKKASLDSTVRFPDFSNVILSSYGTEFTREGGYTVAEDCWGFVFLTGVSASLKVNIYVDGSTVFGSGNRNSTWDCTLFFPIKKGQTITSNQEVNMTLYGMMKDLKEE